MAADTTPQTTPQTTPETSTEQDDPREAARQILGDLDHAYTGDWHQSLKDAAARWAKAA